MITLKEIPVGASTLEAGPAVIKHQQPAASQFEEFTNMEVEDPPYVFKHQEYCEDPSTDQELRLAQLAPANSEHQMSFLKKLYSSIEIDYLKKDKIMAMKKLYLEQKK